MGKFMPGQSWSYFANDIIKCIASNKICNLRKANLLRRVPLDLTEHGTFVRYVKLQIVYAPGRSGTFSSPPRVSDPDVHHGTCVAHVPCWMSGSLTRGLLWTQWRGKRSLHPGVCTTRNFAYLVRRHLVYEIYENICSIYNIYVIYVSPGHSTNYDVRWLVSHTIFPILT